MSALPKCKGLNCPHGKETCKRFIVPANPMRQVWTGLMKDRNGKCQEYYPIPGKQKTS